MKIDLRAINAGIQELSTVLPQLAAAYAAYRVIWSVANPGKSEADYIAHLGERANATVSAADAILMADGFVRDAAGNWAKPTNPA